MKGEPTVGVLKDSLYYYRTNITKTKGLFNLDSEKMTNIKDKYPNKTLQMDSLLNAYYHTTKYLYFNNKKSDE